MPSVSLKSDNINVFNNSGVGIGGIETSTYRGGVLQLSFARQDL
jgi:hypothetical protein